MPRNLHRFYGANDLHFLTFSCFRRQPFLDSAYRRDLFLQSLERILRRYRLVVLGYVVMPEHVHLLLSEPQRANLSTVVQALKLSVCRQLQSPSSAQHRLWPEPARFWQARFYDFNIWTERKRVEKLRYIHRNPVNRGLVFSPEQWRWSSFRWYVYGEAGPVKICDTEVLVMRYRGKAA